MINKLLVRGQPPATPATMVDMQPAFTLGQGFAILKQTGVVSSFQNTGTVTGLVDCGTWGATTTLRSRRVRIVGYLTDVPQSLYYPSTPSALPGAMLLVSYQSQNGTLIKRLVAVPCDFEVVASYIKVQATSVLLPVTATPQTSIASYPAVVFQYQVNVGFMEGAQDLWPSYPLYPWSIGQVYPNQNLGAAGNAPLFPGMSSQFLTLPVENFAPAQPLQGWLRYLQVTNAGASTVYLGLVDYPAAAWLSEGGFSGAGWFVSYPACGWIAVPAGTTVGRRFDDLPFVYGPLVGVFATPPTSAGASFASGAAVFVEGNFLTIAPPGY